jgi:hypothetical protein
VDIAWRVPEKATSLVVVHPRAPQGRTRGIAKALQHKAPVFSKDIIHPVVQAHAQCAAVDVIFVRAQVRKEQSCSCLGFERQETLVQTLNATNDDGNLANRIPGFQLLRLGRGLHPGREVGTNTRFCKVEDPVVTGAMELVATERADFLDASSRQRLKCNDDTVIGRQSLVVEDKPEIFTDLSNLQGVAARTQLLSVRLLRPPFDQREPGSLRNAAGAKQRRADTKLVANGLHAIAARSEIVTVELHMRCR